MTRSGTSAPSNTRRPRWIALGVALAIAAPLGLVGGCPSSGRSPEGLDPSTLPIEQRADYEVFAQRCSKCHSLSRPLNSGIDTDEYWKIYVERMRRQPSSGISVEDEVPILRFLHYYAMELRRQKAAREATSGGDSPAPSASASSGGAQ